MEKFEANWWEIRAVTGRSKFQNKIELSWSDVASADYYSLYRGDDSSKVTTLVYEGSATNFADYVALHESLYFYQVIAHNIGGSSPPSEMSAGKLGVGPSAVSDLSIEKSKDDLIFVILETYHI